MLRVARHSSARRLKTSTVVSEIASALSRCVLFEFEAENVAAEMEGPDLSAPIAEKLVGAHRAGDDLVDEFRLLPVTVNFFVLHISHAGTDEFVTAREQ